MKRIHKKGAYMSFIIGLILGTMFGSFMGIAIICCLQINRIEEDTLEREMLEKEKNFKN